MRHDVSLDPYPDDLPSQTAFLDDKCPATREAVEEEEDRGEVGCPLCGLPAQDHPKEWWDFA